MNYLEINKIFSKMLRNTRMIKTNLDIEALRRGLVIDKNLK